MRPLTGKYIGERSSRTTSNCRKVSPTSIERDQRLIRRDRLATLSQLPLFPTDAFPAVLAALHPPHLSQFRRLLSGPNQRDAERQSSGGKIMPWLSIHNGDQRNSSTRMQPEPGTRRSCNARATGELFRYTISAAGERQHGCIRQRLIADCDVRWERIGPSTNNPFDRGLSAAPLFVKRRPSSTKKEEGAPSCHPPHPPTRLQQMLCTVTQSGLKPITREELRILALKPG